MSAKTIKIVVDVILWTLISASTVAFIWYLQLPEPVPVQTVDWYLEHDVEREAMLKRCNNNPGQLRSWPDCVNVERANSLITQASKIQ
ncbi:EexN family lipoprotein [Neorhizobium sp. T786]|uniref:EexN family lipoprotein n=1 Tax=Pseudorhizobium xiangyangii TaxID=2883104 RepID=UPI001CFF6DB9|nr:EexN family lipoprotein [Neorhizobium xiangyangii]MCB5205167.1 EexN family lipoprotein [Neorhizobium xiangyangii]